MSPTLGKIKKVPLREIFKNEAQDFTPWLEQNISQLSEVIGIEIEDVKRENGVGEFNADLIGTEVNSESRVIIENQLEDTDHKHLGQLITYASGIGAKYIVWVAKNIREEHQKALEWLNENATQGFSFFGVEVSAIRINDGPPAVNFELIIEPNTWSREVKQSTQQVDDRHKRYLYFFTRLVSEYEKVKPEWGHLTASPAAWLTFGAGKAGFRFTWSFRGNNRFSTELFIDVGDKEVNKTHFAELKELKGEIDEKIPSLEWEELPDRKGSRIALYYQMPAFVTDLTDEQIDNLMRWCIEKMDIFKKVFPKYINYIKK